MLYDAVCQYSITPLFHYSRKGSRITDNLYEPPLGALRATSPAAGTFDGRGFFIVSAGGRWLEGI
jgi:hypothetical protein